MSKHVNDHMMEVVGPAINDGLAAYFATTVVVVPPIVIIQNGVRFIAGGNANRHGYRRGTWGNLLVPASFPELLRISSQVSNGRVAILIDGDYTAESITDMQITNFTTPGIELFGPPSVESYDGTTTTWRWNAANYQFAIGSEYNVSITRL